MRKTLTLLLVLSAAAGCSRDDGETIEAAPPGPEEMEMTSDSRAFELRQGLRDLWADHVIWTRDYVIAATTDHPSAQAALDRLLKNQEDLGNAIVPYYGAEAGTQLTELLKDHIRFAGDVVAAAKVNDDTLVESANQRWHENAVEIATYLNSLNPSWPKDDLQAMLEQHLALTTQEATARLEENWEEDQQVFDRIYDQAASMADAMADGILQQFP